MPARVAASGVALTPGGRWGDLWPRLGSAVALGLLVLVATAFGGVPFALVWTLAGLIILVEWLRLTGAYTPLVAGVGLLGVGLSALGVAAASPLLGAPLITLALIGAASLLMGLAAPRSKGWAAAAAPVATPPARSLNREQQAM